MYWTMCYFTLFLVTCSNDQLHYAELLGTLNLKTAYCFYSVPPSPSLVTVIQYLFVYNVVPGTKKNKKNKTGAWFGDLHLDSMLGAT